MIKELIVVEGKKDAAAVRRAFPEADVLVTNGWGLTKRQIAAIRTAHARRGVIIFTDPDHAGEQIRRRLQKMLPGCRHAFVPGIVASDGKVGVEKADAETIRKALEKVRSSGSIRNGFEMSDLLKAGLVGTPDAAKRRRRLGELLAVGYGNSKNFLWRLNALGVSRTEFEAAVQKLEAKSDGYYEARKHNKPD
ncbi:MAG: ribonuclease M5 [Firmicutes bacterium]|nr:ribonuclease M5 [Bacillota bacterium]